MYTVYLIKKNFGFSSLAETKSQFARDDPAFLVLLSFWLCGK
jgi:hypothetical protein